MTVENQTSIPQNRVRKQKEIYFNDADGTTKDIWTPASGRMISINDIIISVINKNATNHIIVALQMFSGGSWVTIVPVAVAPSSSVNFSHNFGGRIHSAIGDGTSRIRVAKQGPSNNWEALGGVTGEEI